MEEGEVEDEREDETGGEEGERGDTPKRGKPVVWRGQQRLGTFVPMKVIFLQSFDLTAPCRGAATISK